MIGAAAKITENSNRPKLVCSRPAIDPLPAYAEPRARRGRAECAVAG